MKKGKIRRLLGLISWSVLLSSLSMTGVFAQTTLMPVEEALHGSALFKEIERQNSSVPLLQVSNMTPQEVQAAKLNWAMAEMGKAVFASVRGEEVAPIPDNAVHIIRSQAGFGHLDDFRLALTLLSQEKGQSMENLVPGPVTPEPSRANNYTDSGWGGFAEYGLASLMAFVYVMWLSSWTAIDLEPHGVKDKEKSYEYPMAA